MKKTLLSSLVLGSVVFGANAALGTTLTIDNFTESFDLNPNTLVNELFIDDFGIDSDTQSQSGLPTSSVIGGTRDTTLVNLNPLTTAFTDTRLISGSGVLDQSVDGDGNLTRATITWNGGGSGLGADLSAFDRFRLNVNNFDIPNNSLVTTSIGTITLRARNNLGAFFSESSVTLNEISSATEIDFLFTNFGGLSLNSISDIQLEIEGNFAGLVFTFGSLDAFTPVPPPIGVPEPSLVFGCLLLGGTQFAITGWKRYKNAKKN